MRGQVAYLRLLEDACAFVMLVWWPCKRKKRKGPSWMRRCCLVLFTSEVLSVMPSTWSLWILACCWLTAAIAKCARETWHILQEMWQCSDIYSAECLINNVGCMHLFWLNCGLVHTQVLLPGGDLWSVRSNATFLCTTRLFRPE